MFKPVMCDEAQPAVDGGCGSMVVATNANKYKAVKWANSRIGGSFSGRSKIIGYNMTCR